VVQALLSLIPETWIMSVPARDDRQRFRGFEAIPVRIVVRVGGASLSLGRLSDLKEGEVLSLDRAVGSPLELIAGGVLLGRVEPVASEEGVGLKLVDCPEDDDDDTSD
jgi:flagellar motor switch/type III secretory pathway protein FliN